MAEEAQQQQPQQQDPNDVEDPVQQQAESSHFRERAVLKGHNAGVTSLQVNNEHTLLVSGSRDCTALVWRLPKQQDRWATEYIRLTGHNHFVSDVCFTSDSTHLLTSSWDKTLRLWNLETRTTKTLFKQHTKDVLAATFSPCNRRIISCSRDKTVLLWNILGECKVEFNKNDAWATCVACAPMENEHSPLIIAVGFWDGTIKVWKIDEKIDTLFTIEGHNGRVLAVSFTPDGQWLVSGGSDHKVKMFSVKNGQQILSFTAPASVSSIATCPTRAWICAATYEGIAVWDIQEKKQIDLVQPNFPTTENGKGRTPDCTSVVWAEDGTVLYSGYNNGEIRVWEVRSE